MAYVAVVGARSLGAQGPAQVRSVVSSLVARGYGIGSGAALGTDQCALVALLSLSGVHPAAPSLSRLCLAWSTPAQCPVSVRGSVTRFSALGGVVTPGWATPGTPYRLIITALQARSALLVGHGHCRAVVAFFGTGRNRGTQYTVHQALGRHRPVFVVGGQPSHLPVGVRCVAGTLGGVAGVWLLAAGYRPDFGG